MTIIQRDIGVTEEQLFGQSDRRTAWTLYNNHATATLYWTNKRGTAVANGFPILPGGAVSLKIPEDDPTEEVWIISDTADTDTRYYEGYKRV